MSARAEALTAQIAVLSTEIDARADMRAGLLDEWAALVFPHKIGDVIDTPNGITKMARVIAFEGTLHDGVPHVKARIRPVRADGRDSFRHDQMFWWVPQ